MPGKRQRRRPPLPFFFALSISLILTFTTYHSYTALPSSLSQTQQCRMSRMWPSYELHHPASPSGLGSSKYNLYLYRENPPEGPTHSKSSRPVVFVHGNAGSYGQVRSVASWAWIQYQAELKAVGIEKAREIDWWTIDFNEEFSAFHAATIEAQSVYLNEVLTFLVQRYGLGDEDIPVLAHSMGGIVARLALLQDGHPRITTTASARVNTLVTLSTPHAIPPAPIERGIQDIYNRINGHTSDLLIVSLSGGLLDTQLPSEYATLPPPALQVFTSDLPTLWSSVDHLAMMWCDQLRRKVLRGFWAAKSLTFNATLQERRGAWHDALLNPDASDQAQLARFMEHSPVADGPADAHHFDVPSDRASAFRLFTSHKQQDLQVLLCKDPGTCSPVPHWAYALVPASPLSRSSWVDFPQAEVYYDSNTPTALRELRLTAGHLLTAGWTSIRIVATGQHAWWRAGWDASAPSRTYHLPNVDSSLVQYSLTLRSPCSSTKPPVFAPMIHAYNTHTGDGRWYPSLQLDADGTITLPVYIHSTSPYLSTPSDGVTVDVYADTPVCADGRTPTVQVTPDITRSLGHLVSRYRVGLVAWPFVAWSLVAIKWIATGELSVVSVNTLSVVPVVVFLAVSQQLLSTYAMSHDALFGLTRQSLRSFGWIYSDWILTTGLGIAAILLGNSLLAAYVLVLEGSTRTAGVLLRPVASALRFDHSGEVDGSTIRPRWRISTTLTILAVLVAVKLYIPYQFIYLSLTLMQILNVVRSRLAATVDWQSKRLEQNRFLSIYLLLLLPLQAPSLLVFVRNFITSTSVTTRRQFHSVHSSDNAVHKILPVLLLVQILSTGRTIEVPTISKRVLRGILVLQALYALVYGIRHTYALYEFALAAFTVLVIGHYACRWGYFQSDGRRKTASEEGYVLVDRVEERIIKDDAVAPFSIPDDVWLVRGERAAETTATSEERARGAATTDSKTEATTSGDDATASDGDRTEVVDGVSARESVHEGDIKRIERQTSEHPAQAYDLDDDDGDDDDANTVQIAPTTNTDPTTRLLETYLRTLDTYTKQRDHLSTTLSNSFFALSADRMASGGWGANVKRELGTAVLNKEVRVCIEENGKWRLELVPLPYLDDDDEEKTLLPTNRTSAYRSGPIGLRRRRQGGRSDGDGDGDAHEDEKKAYSTHGEKRESRSHEDNPPDKAKESLHPNSPSPPRRRHPSALQQYSALPSANLRKARQGFKDVLDLVAGADGSVGNLMQLQMQLTSLEEQIRQARKGKRGVVT